MAIETGPDQEVIAKCLLESRFVSANQWGEANRQQSDSGSAADSKQSEPRLRMSDRATIIPEETEKVRRRGRMVKYTRRQHNRPCRTCFAPDQTPCGRVEM